MPPTAYTLAGLGEPLTDVTYDEAAAFLGKATGETPDSVTVRAYLLAAAQLHQGIAVDVEYPGIGPVTMQLTVKEVAAMTSPTAAQAAAARRKLIEEFEREIAEENGLVGLAEGDKASPDEAAALAVLQAYFDADPEAFHAMAGEG